MFSKLVSLAALAAVANAEHWIFGGTKLIAQTRLDSIVNPDAIGTHVHAIAGASGFSNVYDPDTLVKSNCTTIPVQPDKSNYWAPQMYHQAQNGTLTPIPTSFNIYYLVRNGAKNAKINAFPKGLRMVAGDTNRRTYNASSFADQAVSYVCLDYNNDHTGDPNWAERPNFFPQNCPDGMRAQVFFPACWDGVNLDSPDHKSHMSYPVDAYNTGDCPDSHPVHLVSLFYEMLVSVDQFDYHGEGTWVLANGDTTGYGHHGDFQNGWDIDLLQEAIDTCTNANGNVMDCPPLAAVFDQAAADACVLEGSIVDEDIGLDAPINRLPGCNPIYGSGQTESCTDIAVPELKPAQNPLPSGWSELGCIAEGTSGRALPALTMKDPGMTRAMCASYCGSHGYKLAGVEFSDECYCDNEVKNGASMTFLTWSECSNHCAGNSYEICGGAAKLTLMSTANPGASSPAPSSSASSVSSAAPHSVSSANTVSLSSTAVASATSVVGTPSAHSAAPTSSTSATSAVLAAPPTASVPAGWTAAGCVSDNSKRALTGFSFSNDAMTVASCVSTCSSKGFSMAGVEFGRECYCGNSLQNMAGEPLPKASCNMPCAADSTTTCGGNWAMNLFKQNNIAIANPTPSSASSVSSAAQPSASASAPSNSTNVSGLPAGWTAIGCASDVPSRTLNVDAYTSEQMTINACIAHCAERGHSMAGLEYARECYCGSAFVNGGGAALADAQCNMPCTGDSAKICGGPMALSVFKNTAGAPSKRGHKARHFGRAAHAHSDMF
ncbi:WSC-domain-containing protein [Trametes coccinea BRFM310]|uniref:WSC-domain-containing protein n=1 Tax=Trametes coccinea (strain BRFM310) TaxID=1353009 RepID=A0A1Y2IV41_TRAC3|nr:WSC-domain-containing protein [Trametes coccinea BRFM310]